MFKIGNLGQFGSITAYRVNGEAVRNSSLVNEEFGTNAIHCDFPALIPDGEIWIEDDALAVEIPFLIANCLYRYKLMAGGLSKDQAYDRALAFEKNLRAHGHKAGEIKVRVLYIGIYTVWLVNGFAIRDKYKTDFIEGGNHSEYDWIPSTELWIEVSLHETEQPFIIGHETVEDYVMPTFHWPYNKAHKFSSLIEYKMREYGEVSLEDAIPLALEILRRMHIRG